MRSSSEGVVFFFNDTATTEIYTLSLHDALPISGSEQQQCRCMVFNFVYLGITVGSETGAYVEPIGDCIFQRSTHDDAFILIDVEISVGYPIRILQTSFLIFIGPELSSKASAGIVSLV